MLGDTIMMSSSVSTVWESAKAAYDAGNTTDGFYTIQLPDWTTPQKIYCDMTNDGGGWMLWFNRIAQAPFNQTMDIRYGPASIGHWSGWTNNNAPGLITTDWLDLTTEGYVHMWGYFDGSKKIRWNSNISGRTTSSPGNGGSIMLIAQENGTTFSESYATGINGGVTCSSVSKKYIWNKIQANSGWSNSHGSSYFYNACVGNWPNLGTQIGNYVLYADNNTNYAPVGRLFGNGASAYYNFGNTYDLDYFAYNGEGYFYDVQPGNWDRYNNQLWVQ